MFRHFLKFTLLPPKLITLKTIMVPIITILILNLSNLINYKGKEKLQSSPNQTNLSNMPPKITRLDCAATKYFKIPV